MRREISEPKHWRSKTYGKTANRRFNNERHQTRLVSKLPADAVDAAFAVDSESDGNEDSDLGVFSSTTKPSEESATERPNLISSLTSQLSMLEAQHKQLSQLLAQAQNQ